MEDTWWRGQALICDFAAQYLIQGQKLREEQKEAEDRREFEEEANLIFEEEEMEETHLF